MIMCMCVDIRKTQHERYADLEEAKQKVNTILPATAQFPAVERKNYNQWNHGSLSDWDAAENMLRALDAEDAAAAASAAGGADEEIQSEEEADASDEEENQYDDDDDEEGDDDVEEEEESDQILAKLGDGS